MKKLYTSILLFSFFLLSSSANSQDDVAINWFKTYRGSGVWIARDAGDNVYTATSEGIIRLHKRDKFGNFLWEVSFTTDSLFNYETPTRVHVDSQGNVIVVGYRYTQNIEHGSRANALIVLKYTPGGNLLWQKIINGYFSAFYQQRYHNNVTSELDANNNIYIASGGNVAGGASGFNAIKVTPAGNTAWMRVENFGGSTFFLVYNIRLKGRAAGLCGFKSLSGPNALIWLLDTAGVSRWVKQNEGSYGRDIAYDNNYNVYLLTSLINGAGTNTASDVSVYKFTITGSQVWLYSYDFGGYEGVNQIKFSPDKNLVICASGNRYNIGGSLYVDWLTIKIDRNGDLLWNQRYDKQQNNDEFPIMMAINNLGEIFITGIGGPWPGGSNLGKRQWVTVKYLRNGGMDWFVPIDTLSEYITGQSITLATDRSLFVVADVSTSVIHLLDFVGAGSCSVPAGLTANSITNNAATISWNNVPEANLYHLQYKTTTASVWIKVSTDQTFYTLTGLFPGTAYDYRVEAVCDNGLSGYTATKQFITLGSGYCASAGLNSSNEWIDLVYLGSMLNSTGNDGGYEDYTHLSTHLVVGTKNTITLSAEIIGGPFFEAWAVWIDFNQDGDFTDAGERVVQYQSDQIGWESHDFTVPVNASTGPTRMRVSLKRGSSVSPCETFARGEVEDYTVNIAVPQINSRIAVSVNATQLLPQLFVAPNPVKNILTINTKGWNNKITLQVYDATGKLIENKRANSNPYNINVSNLPGGIYMLRAVDDRGNTSVTKFVKE